MSYNGSGTFQINTSGQPVVTGTVISSSAFNALTADLATGLSTAITKDGQTATTVRIPFAQGINSSLTTDTTSGSTGSIYTAGGVGITKGLFVGGTATFSATPVFSALTASSAVATDASKNLVSVTNTGTGNNVLATSPTITTPTISSLTSAAATALTLQSAGTTAVTVDTSQNVGIGTTSPVTYGKFAVAGTSAFGVDQTDYIAVIGGGGTARVETVGGNTNINLSFAAKGTGSTYFWRGGYGGTASMLIDGSGNVGIGTTSPNFKVSFGANIGKTFALFENAGASVYGIGMGGAGSAGDPYRLKLFSNGTENACITDAGNFLINATSTGSFSAGARLGVLGIDGEFASVFRAPTTANYIILSCDNPNGQVGKIQTGGSATSFLTSSDYRLKEDIVPMTGALAKVAMLKPVTYKWKVDGTDGQGFIAHELAEVVPDCVGGEKDAVDANGNPQYQGVDTSFLVATLTAAIQELTARVVALEAK